MKRDTQPKEKAAAKEHREARTHKSDCAIYNEPALPAGPCSCGADKRTLPASAVSADGTGTTPAQAATGSSEGGK